MGVPQFTTPTFTLTFTDADLDLTAVKNIYVTLSQTSYSVTKTGSDLTVTEKTVSLTLTQKECGQFKTGDIQIQVNWTMPDGRRAASNVAVYRRIDLQLLRKVVE